MIIKRLIAFVLCLLLFCCLTVIPFVHFADSVMLKSDFVKDLIYDLGIYDEVYVMFMEKGEEKVVGFFDDKDLGEDTGQWLWANIDQVMDEDYVEEFVKQNVDASVGYIIDDTQQLATFDLMPKYEELQVVTSENFTLDIFLGFLPEEVQFMLEMLGVTNAEGESSEKLVGVLKLVGIVDADGVIKAEFKDPVIESVFENNDEVKRIFMLSTTEELMEFVGFEDINAKLDAVQDKLHEIQGYYYYLLPVTIALILLMLLLGIKKSFGLSFKGMGITFAISSLVLFASSVVVRDYQDEIFDYISDFIVEYGLTINNQPIFNLVDMVSKEAIRFGMGYVVIAVVLVLFSLLFRKKKDKKVVM